tara:strand:+ start:691 stop:1107 length:417 start_codon:yes stop_codon:yes gene_type:complete
VSHFANYIKSLVAFGEPRLSEINWLFESLINSLNAAQKNAELVRTSQSVTSLRHAKNLLSFLSRSLTDLPDETLVEHLEEFFDYMEESLDRSIGLPLVEEIEELSSLIQDLRSGWEKLIAPTTSAPYQDIKAIEPKLA